jgi:hypothetical protein
VAISAKNRSIPFSVSTSSSLDVNPCKPIFWW